MVVVSFLLMGELNPQLILPFWFQIFQTNFISLKLIEKIDQEPLLPFFQFLPLVQPCSSIQ